MDGLIIVLQKKPDFLKVRFRIAINCYKRNTIPNIYTLEAICKSFGITLSQFFAENDLVELTPELLELFTNWSKLSEEKKKVLMQVIKFST